ncbi:hypothetical protein KYC5002_35480 [Archangium violaceum]|uniref:cytochrome c peroxidase n=1 Tax=Archangium violaceum TaxID=83451 RepID=UPI002B30B294|nr:hypothetical protein KYC5002_35480 [Archangium gephyra]
MLPVLAFGLAVALGSSAPQPGPKPQTFEEMVAMPVTFEGRNMIPLPPKVPRRALRFESAPENRGPARTLPWVNLPGDTDGGRRTPWAVLLGEMLFHAPRTLGPLSVRMGVSCHSCHPHGATNPTVFTEHSYMVPGSIDLTVSYFSPTGDDGILNAHVVPTLRGIRFTAPYPLDGRTYSLREQVRNVIVGEFAVPEVPGHLMDALVAFLNQLDPLPNPKLGPRGRLAPGASEAAQRGEAAFFLPRPALDGDSCATCHPPELGFTDGKVHVLGSQRERYDTPTLLGLVHTPPYLHDARARTIPEALVEVDKMLGLGLSADERKDLTAYLETIGDEADPYEPDRSDRRVALSLSFVDLVLEGPYSQDPLVWRLTLETVMRELEDELKGTRSLEPFLAAARPAFTRPPNDEDRRALRTARKALLDATRRSTRKAPASARTDPP